MKRILRLIGDEESYQELSPLGQKLRRHKLLMLIWGIGLVVDVVVLVVTHEVATLVFAGVILLLIFIEISHIRKLTKGNAFWL